MKVMLLAGLYLFFLRVLWSVFNELRDPRTVPPRRTAAPAGAPAAKAPAGNGSASKRAARRAERRSPALAGASPMASPAATPSAVGQLVVVDPAEFAGLNYSLGISTTLGRAETNDIILDDTYVSTVHARVFQTNGAYFVEDLSSRNGTLLNDQLVGATTALMAGDLVQIGTTTMEFR